MLADLTVAVEVGMVMAALMFIRRVTRTTTVSRVTPDYIEAGRPHILQDKTIPDYVAIFRIHGPFLFGSTDKLHDIALQAETLPPVVILRLRNMTAVDGTGPERDRGAGRRSARRRANAGDLRRAGAAGRRDAEGGDSIAGSANENICASVQAALDRAAAIVRPMRKRAGETAHRSARRRRADDVRPRRVPPTPCSRSSRSPACRRTGTA